MLRSIKKICYMVVLIMAVLFSFSIKNSVYADAPDYDNNFKNPLTKKWYVVDPDKNWVSKDNILKENIFSLFYPSGTESTNNNRIYFVIRDITLWLMIIYLVWAWASLLFNRKPEDMNKMLRSLVYVIVWWCFVYWANRLFGSVLQFTWPSVVGWTDWWVPWVANAFTNKVAFFILSAIKAAAFFMAIIMTVITWIRVVAAWDWEKWKKLVKWLINIVVSLLIIKWIDFIYYVAQDSSNFVQNAADFIVDAAKVFGYIFWVIIVIMVIIAWYLYITDGWSGSNFKKASNILINILLSALILFAFLLILYQIFAEFQTWGDAVWPDPQAYLINIENITQLA